MNLFTQIENVTVYTKFFEYLIFVYKVSSAVRFVLKVHKKPGQSHVTWVVPGCWWGKNKPERSSATCQLLNFGFKFELG